MTPTGAGPAPRQAKPAPPQVTATAASPAGTASARQEATTPAAASSAPQQATTPAATPAGTTSAPQQATTPAATPAGTTSAPQQASTPAATSTSTSATRAPAPATEPAPADAPAAQQATAPTAGADLAPVASAPEGVALEGQVSGRTPGLDLAGIRSRLRQHPGFAPELLALAAVEGIGPRARDWAHGLREAYPDAGPDGLARLATRRFVRVAGLGGATSALAGLFAPVAELATVLWTQAALVLHLAAAYGRDPRDAERAVELLVLTQVHPDADSARAALDAARAADGPGDRPWPRAAEAAWRLAAPLAAQAGGWVALRLASRLVPGAAVLAAAAGDAAAAERLAARAVAAYRPVRAS
ncbi:hypothetical protein [Micromonospora coxensis]|uniref:hypothetical protein n=1 Tax=Micromonospora coxensis TaxID=356852 RepID=UPI0018D52D7D|nr:hypothetical protein [Micromonospora coxensis]